RPAAEPAGPPVAGRQVAEVPVDDPQAEPVRRREVRQHRPAQRATGKEVSGGPERGPSSLWSRAMLDCFPRPPLGAGAVNAYHAYLLDGLLQVAPQIDRVL